MNNIGEIGCQKLTGRSWKEGGIGPLERGGLLRSKRRAISSTYEVLLHKTNVTNVVGEGQVSNLT